MTQVKPAEVSAILRQQLSGFKSEAELEEVGTVLQVGDGIARIYGLTNAQSGELVEFEGGLQAIVLNLEEDNVGAVLLGPSKGIKEGDIVKRTNKIASVNVGEGMLGRVLDGVGVEVVLEGDDVGSGGLTIFLSTKKLKYVFPVSALSLVTLVVEVDAVT